MNSFLKSILVVTSLSLISACAKLEVSEGKVTEELRLTLTIEVDYDTKPVWAPRMAMSTILFGKVATESLSTECHQPLWRANRRGSARHPSSFAAVWQLLSTYFIRRPTVRIW